MTLDIVISLVLLLELGGLLVNHWTPNREVVLEISRLSTDSYIPIKLLYFGSKSYIFKHLLYSYKFSYILKIFPIFLGKFVADEYIVNSSALILPFAS